MNRAWNAVLGGWQMTDIFQARSGDPLTMAYSPDTATQVSPLITISGRNSYRPNQSGSALATNKSYAHYLNVSNFSTPQPYAPFGTSPRNAVRGYAFWQLDTGLTKDFALTGKAHVQFRAEAFNLTNRTNFGEPNTMILPPRSPQRFARSVRYATVRSLMRLSGWLIWKPSVFARTQCRPTISTPAAVAASRSSARSVDVTSPANLPSVNGAISTPV